MYACDEETNWFGFIISKLLRRQNLCEQTQSGTGEDDKEEITGNTLLFQEVHTSLIFMSSYMSDYSPAISRIRDCKIIQCEKNKFVRNVPFDIKVMVLSKF